MTVLKRSAALLSFAIALLTFTSANAAITLQMNLEQMVTQSERVFVGQVVSITETRVAMGGGELPAVTYRLRQRSIQGRLRDRQGRAVHRRDDGRFIERRNGRHPPDNGFPGALSGY